MSTPDTTMTPMGQRLRERTLPLAPDDEANGYAHAYLSEALVRGMAQTAQIIDPQDPYPPWAPLFDIDGCPDFALPWLGQCVGVPITPGMDPVLARDLIRNMFGTRRGSVAAIRAAIQAALGNPNATVYFRERNPTAADPPYSLEVVTLTGETPDPALVTRAITAQKPAGIVLTSRTVAHWDWQQVHTDFASWSALKAAYLTWRGVLYKEPGT